MTYYNVTGLLPGTTYELTVMAVSNDQGGDIILFAVSLPSGPQNGSTGSIDTLISTMPPCTSSNLIIVTVLFSSPLICEQLPLPYASTSNQLLVATITITWSYIHTGGLPLTSVSVVYRFEEGLALSPPVDVEIANTVVTIATMIDLVAGRLYTFTISNENSNGSSSIDCGPIRHNLGENV